VLASADADRILVVVDPQRWLPSLFADLTRATGLDSKVQASVDLLVERLRGQSEQQQVALATLLWAWIRSRLRAGMDPHLVRRALADGARTLAVIEVGLERQFSDRALDLLTGESVRMMAPDSKPTGDLPAAAHEVSGFLSELAESDPVDVVGPGVKIIALAGLATGVLIVEAESAIHGHPGPLHPVHH
jgi:hypothetical protein